ncbi:MAG: hypothetical protein K2L87_00740 [Clostridiales bacterium]|nr:hypothetical protein [Clostridiales bacterium]
MKLKRLTCFALSAVCLAGAFGMTVGCGKEDEPDPGKTEELMTYNEYNLKTYLTPFWEGGVVYNETLWFAGSQSAPLLYKPDEVISVMSYDMKTTYEEDVDYIVEENGLIIPADGKIPFLPHSELYRKSAYNPMVAAAYRNKDGNPEGFLYADEGQTISKQQVVVTYKHSDTMQWNTPRVETAKFPKTMAKLENGEDIKVLFYGDSITVGANSSEYIGIAPHAESYANMVKSYMKARFPKANIEFKNNAVGGTDSNWGIDRETGIAGIDNIVPDEKGQHFQKRVLDVNPDLLFIAYGMNDQAYDAVQCKANIKKMIETVRAQNPNVEIMLVSGMIANPETFFDNKDYEAYQTAFIELSEEFQNVGIATVYNSVKSVYTKKRFVDCTANNINHPNDFMMRVYAQTVLYSLFGADYIKHI